MRTAFLRGVVAFFTRPLRLADIGALVRRPRHDSPPANADESSYAQTAPAPFKESLGQATGDRWRDLDPAVDVSEEPLETLPAELREELTRAMKKPDEAPRPKQD